MINIKIFSYFKIFSNFMYKLKTGLLCRVAVLFLVITPILFLNNPVYAQNTVQNDNIEQEINIIYVNNQKQATVSEKPLNQEPETVSENITKENPVKQEVQEQDEKKHDNEISLFPEKTQKAVTFSELIRTKKGEHEPENSGIFKFIAVPGDNDREENSFWGKIKNKSLITAKSLQLEKPKINYNRNFSSINAPSFVRSYGVEELKKSENKRGKPDLKPNNAQWEFRKIENRAGVKLFNLKASKEKPPFSRKELLNRTWDFIKGEPINNSLLLGMFSHHTSNKDHNETHNLLGIDYKGYSVGTFKNSFSDQTYYAGISRKLYEYEFRKNIKFDVKYKLVAMYGYQDHYPDLAGITPLIMPMFGLSFGYTGVDFMAIPAKNPTFTVNFRFNLPQKNILKKSN